MVIIYDRYLTIGNFALPFACQDPHPSNTIPANDESWDKGVSLNAPIHLFPL